MNKNLFWVWIGLGMGAAFALLVISTTPAPAGEFVTIQRTGNGYAIQRFNVDANPRVIKRRADLSDEAAERAARWEDYCQPRTVTGAWGVERYVYAHAGCEFGKDHD